MLAELQASFVEAYPGGQYGYVQVMQCDGHSDPSSTRHCRGPRLTSTHTVLVFRGLSHLSSRMLDSVLRSCVTALICLQVTRASGHGPVLLLLPLNGTSFEAWRPLRGEDTINSDQSTAFEGTNQLMLHTHAYATHEW